ncbi:MAG TPA: SDR family NAD(P)-dependent oxidoreductase, partial [Longimicrobiaceae bacterium]|nr:SDR family NAD(P)-dependent oxidoreductase [Longimicrobiaceae bacterium]
LYVRGAEVEWGGVHGGGGRRRVELPTYSFQRARHWIETDEPAAGVADELGEWTYSLAWRPEELAPGPAGGAGPGVWVVFADRGGVAEEVAAHLEADGDRVVLVSAGEESGADGAGYTLRPHEPEDAARLFGQVLGGGAACRGVLHFWGLDARLDDDSAPGALEEAQALGPCAVLHTVQALVRAGAARPPRLWIVTRAAQGFDGGTVHPAQAPLWGLGRVIALEHPELWGGLIDLDPAADTDEARRLAREVTVGDAGDQVAFRGGRRHVARLVRAAPPGPTEPVVHGEASYLVTGGLGSLGIRVAQWLVARGARSVLLVGRRDPGAAARDIIAAMEHEGARVTLVRADVADRAGLEAALAAPLRELLPLRGVVHAAGSLDDGVLYLQDAARFAAVMAPKVAGAWNLHRLTLGLPLDFFTLFSSAASLLGSPGQGNYAAGNAFLDALAHHRRARGLPAVSINWGPWAEVGMSASLEERSSRQWVPRGVTPVRVADGLQAFGRLSGGALPQVGVLPVEWGEFMAQFPAGAFPRVLREMAREAGVRETGTAPAAGDPPLLAALRQAPPSERRALLTDGIQQRLARVMGLDGAELPEADLGFFQMGLDSLMAIELKSRLGADLGIDLPTTLVFQHPTIEALVDYLLPELVPAEVPEPAAAAPGVETVEVGSEDELLALLARELG